MVAEAEKMEFMDNCNTLQPLSQTQLPELIKRFDPKFNQKPDVGQVKSGGGPRKMKLRDAPEVLEIARLKVLVSEMREKAAKMEAQLMSAAEKHKGSTKLYDDKRHSKDSQVVDGTNNSTDSQDLKTNYKKDLQNVNNHDKDSQVDVMNNNADLRDVEKVNTDLCMERQRDYVEIRLPDVKCNRVDADAPQDGVFNNKDLQDFVKSKKALLEEQNAPLDKETKELCTRIMNLQCDIDEMLLELSKTSDLEEELATTKERIKMLQEEIKDDAGFTKAQLLLLKQQFGGLEEIKVASTRKEFEYHKVLQISSAVEAEVAELKNGNRELLKHTQELSKKLQSVLKKAEKITLVTKDDVLASEAEVSKLRSTNMELQKTVESLQISRFNEVEEVVYLRWVNACLRHDLDTYNASRRNSEVISDQRKNCSTSLHGKDKGDRMSRTNSGRSFTSYGNVHDYSASQNDDEDIPPSYEGSTKSSPRIAITHGHVDSSHSSPKAITHGCVDSTHTSPLAIMHGHENSSHTSPQYPHYLMAKTKSGPLIATQQHSPSNSYLSQSPEAYNPCQASPGKAAIQRDPRRISEIQSRLSFNDRSEKSDAASYNMTTFTSNSSRRSGRSFNRSASNVSSSSEALINRTQSSPKKQDMRKFMRSSSTLSSESDISITSQNMNASSLRRHSASSGTSLLDEYLQSTDTRSLNKPTSRFSAVLPYDRQLSDSASVSFPIIKVGADPAKRRDHTNKKTYSFKDQLNGSDRVVAAFQVLSASTHTDNTHPTFKELSRRNSRDEKAASKVDDDQMEDEHRSSENAHTPSEKSAQTEFFCDLARAIQVTHYESIDKVAAFVNWFDRQGDEEKQEFFSFPDCPKDKVEAMRRAVYEYEELEALEIELKSYQDDLKKPADLALQDMKHLLEKVESHIQGFKQAREATVAQFIELDIPTHWMLDSEMIAKIKQASLRLAQKYIKRVTTILKALGDDKISRESRLLQAAKFLLLAHNFAGGFDENTANAFKVLQSQADIHENDVACCSIPSQ
eukprot:c22153_g2_i1 orf=63-3140(-)